MACKICGNRKISDLKLSKTYFFCTNCKVAWMKKFPEASYEKNYNVGKSGVASKIFQPIEGFFYWLRKIYIGNNQVECWVDVGAGDGRFLKTTNAKKKIGVEVSKFGRKIMEDQGLKAMTNKDFLTKQNINADVISFWHVLEHLDDPLKYLNTAKRNLSKTGKIVIGIPNIDSFEFQIFRKFWFHLAPKYHLWHYSPTSLSLMLSKTGFRIDFIDYFAPEHHLVGILQSFLNKTTGSENILHKIVKRGTDSSKITPKTAIYIGFWLSLGLPIISSFWIVESFLHRSGAIVVVASKSK